MFVNRNQFNFVKKIIKKGFVKHSQIIPLLNKANIQHIDADDIANASLLYKSGTRSGVSNIFLKKIKSILYLILSIMFFAIGAVFYTETIASKIFAATILKGKLNGFCDNILFWAGFKKVLVSGTDMFTAMAKVIEATPVIIKGFFIGGIIGLILWIIAAMIIGFLFRIIRLNIIVAGLFKNH